MTTSQDELNEIRKEIDGLIHMADKVFFEAPIKVGDRVVLADSRLHIMTGKPRQEGIVRDAWLDVYPDPSTLPPGEPAQMIYYAVDWFAMSDEEWAADGDEDRLKSHREGTIELATKDNRS